MKFDLDGIKADGYDVTTPIVVTNADEFTIQTVAEGAVVPGAALLKLEANKRGEPPGTGRFSFWAPYRIKNGKEEKRCKSVSCWQGRSSSCS